VDVGAFVVPDAQPSELIEPGKSALHDPAPTAQAAAVPRAAHGYQRNDPTDAQSISDRHRVVTAVPDDTVWPTPPSSPRPLQRRNAIH